MTALRARLDRLEQGKTAKVWGRFICIRAGRCTEDQASDYLRGQGVTVGRRDLVLIDTHADSGTSVHVAPDEPISHQIIECIERFEDMLKQLEEQT